MKPAESTPKKYRSNTYGTVHPHDRDGDAEVDVEQNFVSSSYHSYFDSGDGTTSVSGIVKMVSLVLAVVAVSIIASSSHLTLRGDGNNNDQQQAAEVMDVDISSISGTSSRNDRMDVNERASSASGKVQRPNFMFILIDDLEWNAFGDSEKALGPITPNLQSLMKDGIYFSKYYGQELCNPARSALLTGRYPSSIGTQINSVQITTEWGLSQSEILLPEVMREGGNYKTYMLGKWHLGHYMPQFLPTSRGFDEFLGYVGGAETYWSKVAMPGGYLDFMYADSECYNRQQNENWDDYSTTFYGQKAVSAILSHDFESQPMFFYFASQSAHEPFGDEYRSDWLNGLNSSIVDADMVEYIEDNIVGSLRQQLFMSLYMLDTVVADIVEAFRQVGQLDNTYIIVSSDNGGCYLNGGRDGPLRGTKASLWEGGTKVDAFIYSPLLPADARGTSYNGLSHITDWFPTIVELAGIKYTPSESNRFDGYSQAKAMIGAEPNPRQYMLYNVYTDGGMSDANVNTNANGAVRNERYKLVHAYVNNEYDYIFYSDVATAMDDQLDSDGDCGFDGSITGDFAYLLFDVDNDISESNNLYGLPQYAEVQAELTEKLEYFADAAVAFVKNMDQDLNETQVFEFWKERNAFVQPWRQNFDENVHTPSLCEKSTVFHSWDSTGISEKDMEKKLLPPK